jgi:hypothetical protein
MSNALQHLTKTECMGRCNRMHLLIVNSFVIGSLYQFLLFDLGLVLFVLLFLCLLVQV